MPKRRPFSHTSKLYCMNTAAAMAPKSATELPRCISEAALLAVELGEEPVEEPWKPAPEVPEVVAEPVPVEEADAVRVAMDMVVLRGRALPVPALMLPAVPTGMTGTTGAGVVVLLIIC